MIYQEKIITIDGQETKKDLAVIMLHGFGANEHDLQALAEYFPFFERWIFPRAPIGLHEDAESYAWFPRQADALQILHGSEGFPDLGNFDSAELQDAGAQVAQLADEIAAEQYVLAGFSQGGMVAIETALQMRKKPAGLMIFSSALVARDRWASSMDSLNLLPVFQCHGSRDEVLPYHRAEELRNLLMAHCNVYFQSFNGGHEISQEILHHSIQWASSNF